MSSSESDGSHDLMKSLCGELVEPWITHSTVDHTLSRIQNTEWWLFPSFWKSNISYRWEWPWSLLSTTTSAHSTIVQGSERKSTPDSHAFQQLGKRLYTSHFWWARIWRFDFGVKCWTASSWWISIKKGNMKIHALLITSCESRPLRNGLIFRAAAVATYNFLKLNWFFFCFFAGYF